MSLFVRKPMGALMNEAQETGTHTLKRTLGAGGLIALGIGAAAYQYARKQDVFSKRNMKRARKMIKSYL